MPHGLVAAALAWEGGIAVRNGCFCAQPYMMQLLGLNPQQLSRLIHKKRTGNLSGIPGMVRVSLAAYNNKKDIDRLIECLEKIKAMAGRELAKVCLFPGNGDLLSQGRQGKSKEVFRLG